MAKFTPDTVTSGYYATLKLNENFERIQTAFENTLSRDGTSPNQMEAPLDMNSHPIINYVADFSDSSSLITVGEADSRYISRAGDEMEGPLKVLLPVADEEPARKDQLDAETAARQSAVANLQAQISEKQPPEASAFSPISWHKQTIENSVDIPDNVNAWSFGPTMTIAQGQAVTIGNNSFWTIANGEQQ